MSHRSDYGVLQRQIGIKFRNEAILEQALTHRSYLNENHAVTGHNENLEFLGDAALEWIVTHYLFRQHGHESEGNLTNIRAKVVCGATLSVVAEELELAPYIRISRGEEKGFASGPGRSRILANALEAIVGAIAVDRGIGTAELFVLEFLVPLCDKVIQRRAFYDAKTYLQEIVQEKLHVTPTYQTIGKAGPEHARSWTTGCYVGDRLLATATARSKREAETKAARTALKDEFRIELPDDKDVLSR